jgi:hypothetical protein
MEDEGGRDITGVPEDHESLDRVERTKIKVVVFVVLVDGGARRHSY